MLKAAQEGGYRGGQRGPYPGGTQLDPDRHAQGADGRRIGWEIQLSTAGTDGPPPHLRTPHSRRSASSGRGF